VIKTVTYVKLILCWPTNLHPFYNHFMQIS